LAFYQDNPQHLRPMWVTNVDSVTRKSITDPATRDRPLLDPATGRPKRSLLTDKVEMDPASGQPLLDWNKDRLDATTIERLVAERRVLQPNSKEPLESVAGLIDDTHNAGRHGLNIEQLAMRRGDEIILNVRAQDELMPRFITEQLPLGIAGLIMAALFAASMSSMDSGLNSICTLLVMDFHRRLGWGRSWLARRLNKSPVELSEADELRLARPLVLVIGVAATLFSLAVARIDNIFSIMIAVVNTFGGPLLAIFLLGVFTRRCTSAAAIASLVIGSLFTMWFMLANSQPAFRALWPFPAHIADIWSVSISVVFTFVFGWMLSFLFGRRKTTAELRGLVVGVGTLGHRDPPDKPPPLPLDRLHR
jgi:hypothetical protein